jgi:hypothetical protein
MLRQLFPTMATAAIVLLCTIGARADTVRLVPSSTEVTPGSTFELNVIAENMNAGGFDFVLGFSPLLVGLSDAGPDVFLGDTLAFEAFFGLVYGLDTVQISEVSLLEPGALQALQGDSSGNLFRLAKLTFQANAPGLAQFAFTQISLTDPQANPISAASVGTSVLIREGTESPVPVPEPATWTLLLAAGSMLWFGGRRRQAKR